MAVRWPHVLLPGPLVRGLQLVRRNLPPLNFITLHYAYFIGVSMIASVIFWGSSTPARSVSYTDSLFLVVSAMTLAGLNTINLSEVNTFQQVILFLLIMMGSAILVSSMVVHVRMKAFERRFAKIVAEERRKKAANRLSRTRSFPLSMSLSFRRHSTDEDVIRHCKTVPPHEVNTEDSPDREKEGSMKEGNIEYRDIHEWDQEPWIDNPAAQRNGSVSPENAVANVVGEVALSPALSQGPPSDHIKFHSDTHFFSPDTKPHASLLSMSGVGARQDLMNNPSASRQRANSFVQSNVDGKEDGAPNTHTYLSLTGGFSRNSRFQGLSEVDREKLGGVEYRAIAILAYIVPIYFVFWQLFGALSVGAWIAVNRPETTRSNGLNPFWVGAFNAISAFNNSGMSLLDANMVAFQLDIFPLIVMGLLILAGNTAYPIFLRWIIIFIKYALPQKESWRDQRVALQFLLDHPRRCYTHLFPKAQTHFLLASLIILNGTDWFAFEILNIGNQAVMSIPASHRWLDGLFQALAVRSGGFYVVSITSLRSGLLVLYVLMMYISVYPVTITMRSSNIYEERSLGIYADEPSPPPDQAATNIYQALKRRFTSAPGQQTSESRSYFIRQQLRGQLAHDSWWICVAVLFITIIETGQFERDPVVFSTFNIIFENISAYGCVGISTGVPWAAYSFSGAWHIGSKLILCAVMLRGRHRGLPVAIDRAVLLPGEDLSRAEEEDAAIRLERGLARARTTGSDALRMQV